MRKLILASHGSLAEGMQSAARMILGAHAEGILAYGLDRWETPQHILTQVKAVMEAERSTEVTILCDIKGGSVYNQLLPLCEEERVCVFTGMNLNLVLELMMADGNDWPAERETAMRLAKEGIACFDKRTIEAVKDMEEDSLW